VNQATMSYGRSAGQEKGTEIGIGSGGRRWAKQTAESKRTVRARDFMLHL
jgi:hypothetical protein